MLQNYVFSIKYIIIGVTIFKNFILVGISLYSIILSEITLYGDAFRPYSRRYTYQNENFEYSFRNDLTSEMQKNNSIW